MLEILTLIECVLTLTILIVILYRKEPQIPMHIQESIDKVTTRVKAFGKKAKHKPHVNDDNQAFKIENDL